MPLVRILPIPHPFQAGHQEVSQQFLCTSMPLFKPTRAGPPRQLPQLRMPILKPIQAHPHLHPLLLDHHAQPGPTIRVSRRQRQRLHQPQIPALDEGLFPARSLSRSSRPNRTLYRSVNLHGTILLHRLLGPVHSHAIPIQGMFAQAKGQEHQGLNILECRDNSANA